MIRLCVGLAFFLLGALKLGVVVGFFPRHILVGHVHSSINNIFFT
jgi:MFS superfamily sulfate permease-like transporter